MSERCRKDVFQLGKDLFNISTYISANIFSKSGGMGKLLMRVVPSGSTLGSSYLALAKKARMSHVVSSSCAWGFRIGQKSRRAFFYFLY